MNVLVFASRKGGSGKSTLAAHLAAYIHKPTRPCLLVDADPQGSLTLWQALRRTGEPPLKAGTRGIAEIVKQAKQDGTEWVLIDTPPNMSAAVTDAIRCATLVVVPTRPSVFDIDAVKERSGLGDAFEYPVSAYSQGMCARLGFAVAEELEPRVLLLDEVHEALDHEFRAIVQERARTLIGTGGVVVATGHDHPLLEQLCDRAIYLDNGTVAADGPFRDVQRAYLEDVRTGTHH